MALPGPGVCCFPVGNHYTEDSAHQSTLTTWELCVRLPYCPLLMPLHFRIPGNSLSPSSNPWVSVLQSLLPHRGSSAKPVKTEVSITFFSEDSDCQLGTQLTLVKKKGLFKITICLPREMGLEILWIKKKVHILLHMKKNHNFWYFLLRAIHFIHTFSCIVAIILGRCYSLPPLYR